MSGVSSTQAAILTGQKAKKFIMISAKRAMRKNHHSTMEHGQATWQSVRSVSTISLRTIQSISLPRNVRNTSIAPIENVIGDMAMIVL
jgi:hypothetical protein